MQIVDSQHHEISPALEWDTEDAELRSRLMAEILLGWMDSAGVDAALLNPLDHEAGVAIAGLAPDRIAVFANIMKPEDIDADATVAQLKADPRVVALRTSFGKGRGDWKGEKQAARFRSGAIDALFAACEKHGMALFCSAYGNGLLVGEIAERHPDLTLVVDHMGLPQPPIHERDDPPWSALDDAIAIAHYPNVAVKVSGAPALSDEAYPYPDIWPHIHRLLEAYGVERLMWASDAGRFAGRIGWTTLFPEGLADYKGKHSYAESLFHLRETDELSAAEKEQLLGGTCKRLIGWPT